MEIQFQVDKLYFNEISTRQTSGSGLSALSSERAAIATIYT